MGGDVEQYVRSHAKNNERIYETYKAYCSQAKDTYTVIKHISVKNLETLVNLEVISSKEFVDMNDTLEDVKNGFRYLADEATVTRLNSEYTKFSLVATSLLGGTLAVLTSSLFPLALPVAGGLLTAPIQEIRRRSRMKNLLMYGVQLGNNVQKFSMQCSNVSQKLERDYVDERLMLKNLHTFNIASYALKDCMRVSGIYEDLVQAHARWST